jgi:phage I-like protein
MAVRTLKPALALAALSVDLGASADDRDPPTALRLVPAGEFRARDGRPEGLAAWAITAASAADAIRYARAQRDDAVIDYEHQTLHAVANGQPAPAAGWWSAAGMEYRDLPAEQGGGLWATDLRWTPRAAEMIRAGEYRYFSPVIAWDKRTGIVHAVPLGALTNRAAVDGLTDLSALSALAAGLDLTPPETPMDLDSLRQLLGLAADADEAAVTAAIAALKAREAAAASAQSRIDALSAELAELRSAAAGDSVPAAVYAETLTALRSLQRTGSAAELDRLLQEGLADGRIPGAHTAQMLRAQGLDACRAWLADAQPIAALTQTQPQPQGQADTGTFTDALKAEFGTREAWEAFTKAEAAGLVKIYGGAA